MDLSLSLCNEWTSSLESLPKIDISHITSWIGNSSKPLQRGYKFFVEEYLRDIVTKTENGMFICKAACYKSQKKNDKPHALKVYIFPSKEVSHADCSCIAG